jgi:hypothetical protein
MMPEQQEWSGPYTPTARQSHEPEQMSEQQSTFALQLWPSALQPSAALHVPQTQRRLQQSPWAAHSFPRALH